MVEATGMNRDIRNTFKPLCDIAVDLGSSLNSITAKIPTYADYFYDLFERTPKMFQYTLGQSSPQAVAAFDAAARDFNSDLERIQKEDDRNAVIRFYNEVDHIVLGADHIEIPEIK